jgi:hypothetical protein
VTAATYGELMAATETALVRATVLPTPSRRDQLLELAAGAEVVRRQLSRQADLAVDPWTLGGNDASRLPEAAGAFAAALRISWMPDHVRREHRGVRDPWAWIAEQLGAATDLLATHVAQDGRWLTADARLLASRDGRLALAGRTADLTDLLTRYVLFVGRHIDGGDATRGGGVDARLIAGGWEKRAGSVRHAAARLLAEGRTADEKVANVAVAPPLRTRRVETLEDALEAFDRLRRFSHAQRYGDVAGSMATTRGYTALGHLITGHARVVHRAAAERADTLYPMVGGPARVYHETTAELLLDANRAWGRLHAALVDVRDTNPRPSWSWRADLKAVRDRLCRLTRDDDGFLPADSLLPDRGTASRVLPLLDRLVEHLPTIAGDQAEAFRRLHVAGQLLVPTSQVEQVDVPRLYTDVPKTRYEQLVATFAATTMSCHVGCAKSAFGGVRNPQSIPQAISRQLDGAEAALSRRHMEQTCLHPVARLGFSQGREPPGPR